MNLCFMPEPPAVEAVRFSLCPVVPCQHGLVVRRAASPLHTCCVIDC